MHTFDLIRTTCQVNAEEKILQIAQACINSCMCVTYMEMKKGEGVGNYRRVQAPSRGEEAEDVASKVTLQRNSQA